MLRKILQLLIAGSLKMILWFRYRITVKGLENLNSKTLNKPGGILFLPNHPAYFVDPIAAYLAVWPKFSVRPMIVEYMYNLPGVNWLARFIDALPVPNFETSTNSLKKKKNDQIVQVVIDDLREKESFLIYPAGRVKHTAYEAVGGASAVHKIVQEVPEVNIVLMRIKGLWGSMFSRALDEPILPLGQWLWKGFKIALKNLIFFSPRRHIIIELEPAPLDFPYKSSRLEFNKYLERWYNKPDELTEQHGESPGDSLILVPRSIWSKELPTVRCNGVKKGESALSMDEIPQEVQNKVFGKLEEVTRLPRDQIQPEMNFAADLGLDSLDVAELAAFLDDEFGLSNVSVTELTTVGRLMGIASGKIVCEERKEEARVKMGNWFSKRKKERAQIAPGKTIPEAFLNNCERMGKAAACGDVTSGVLTYADLKMRVVLIAEYIRKLPGEYVGILLPASVGAYVLSLACQLAGKIPLMVNWTVGPRHLQSVVALSNVQTVLTAWSFLDRLDKVDLDGLEDRLLMLEDIRSKISMKHKIKALLLSKRSPKAILKHFGADKISKDFPAVLLFTSGSEGMPKGVPLSHENILSNQRATLDYIEIDTDDVVFGVLPPFHSFGFAVTGILELLSGIRIAFSPDPTDGKRMAGDFFRFRGTIMLGAPSFLKGMLKAATKEQIETMRICVTGAEKAPPELFQLAETFGKKETIVEGYGITECAPIISANQPGKPLKGVGRALPGVELLIVHPETKEVMAQGEQGLILTYGPNVFSGYLNPGIGSPFIEIQGKKWYKTGDLGYLDPEGNLFISGRLKRFMKVGGEMVSLTAIEEALLHKASLHGWELVEEGASLAIIARETPGEKPHLILFSCFKTSADTVNQILRKEGFSNLVKVSEVIQIEAIPLMGTGKINYRVLETDYA